MTWQAHEIQSGRHDATIAGATLTIIEYAKGGEFTIHFCEDSTEFVGDLESAKECALEFARSRVLALARAMGVTVQKKRKGK